MPTAPRPSTKATKIAYAILGKPANMSKRSKKKTKNEKRLVFEETSRVR